MTKEEDELKELEVRAASGDRDAIRELRLRKLSDYAGSTVGGALKPDANGRVAGDPLYRGGATK